jgi:hypothetical protein
MWGCAAKGPKWSLEGPQTIQARAAYLACSERAMASYGRPAGERAVDLATAAVGSCAQHHEALRWAIEVENRGAGREGTFADAFVLEERKRLVSLLADAYLKQGQR